MRKIGLIALQLLAGAAFLICQADAAEQGKSVYLLGATSSMAGMSPPPGTYLSSLSYFYSGDASGSSALGRSLPLTGISLPGSATLQTNANLKVQANVALDVFSALWVAPEQVLGGSFGVGALLPVGYQEVGVNVNALSTLTFPNGSVLGSGGSRDISGSTFAIGDPLATAFLGWSAGNWHWKVTGLVNVPVGQYNKTSLVNMGFNRWAADLTGALTWLDPKSGFELSLAPGFTVNGENPDLQYRTGNEFHLEAAVMEHFSQDFAIGAAGYHYEQVTGDSGPGAVLGPFKGRVSAIGPNLAYNFKVGNVPVITSARWLHEFDVVNRLQGDVGILTLTVPLGGTAAH